MPMFRVEYVRISREVGQIVVKAVNSEDARRKADDIVETNEERLTMVPEEYTVELEQLDVEPLDDAEEE